jgi:hypothetical protein
LPFASATLANYLKGKEKGVSCCGLNLRSGS